MGPSGCGKSTLLHLLGGLERPTAGEVWLEGRRIDELSEKALARLRRTAIGFVFQAFHLMEELTAIENVELPALLAGARRAPRDAGPRSCWIRWATDRAERLPSALSAVSVNGSRSRARWATTRPWFWPTSRPATSTAPRHWTCSGSWTACARAGRRC